MRSKTDEHCIGATINGYDGSLLNGLQTMAPWQDCKCYQTFMRIMSKLTIRWETDFGNPTSGRLGLFTAIQNIGGICALFFCEYSNTAFYDIVPS